MKVEYITHMGDDLMVVDAARVSFDKKSELVIVLDEDGPRDEDNYPISLKEELSKPDQKLIKYLAKHGHWTPFAHPQIQMRVTVPIFIANQLKRHQIGLSVNEVSRRYVDDEPKFYYPETWRKRPDKSIKQGSGEDLTDEEQEWIKFGYNCTMRTLLNKYHNLLNKGVAPEMARMVLPQSMYTSWIWTGSLMAWLRIYQQRSDSHAQKESQMIAQQIKEVVQPLFPVSWAAWFERT